MLCKDIKWVRIFLKLMWIFLSASVHACLNTHQVPSSIFYGCMIYYQMIIILNIFLMCILLRSNEIKHVQNRFVGTIFKFRQYYVLQDRTNSPLLEKTTNIFKWPVIFRKDWFFFCFVFQTHSEIKLFS